MREAFPDEHSMKYLIFDRDARFGCEVVSAVEAIELACVRTSFKSPWQNGVAERWVGSCRRDLLGLQAGERLPLAAETVA